MKKNGSAELHDIKRFGEIVFDGVPDEAKFTYCQFAATSIALLSDNYSDRWGLSLTESYQILRLSAGWVECLVLSSEKVRVLLYKRTAPPRTKFVGREYANAKGCQMAEVPLPELHSSLPGLRDSHEKALSIAGARPTTPAIRAAHSVGATKWLSSLVHSHVPNPSYIMNDYIAYHSEKVMGRDLGPIRETVRFRSKKPESFLQGAIGARVWVISSTKEQGHLNYRLEGTFTPRKVSPEGGEFHISGPAEPCRPRPTVTTSQWFRKLLKEQNNFSYGFNRIKDAAIVSQMQRLIRGDGQETVTDPALEGAKLQVLSNRYERNALARRQCIAHYGCRCIVCNFDFGAVYGKRGEGFINVHHLKPLALIGKQYKVDPIMDLRPVCPNCHSMIHSGREMLSVDELKQLIQLSALARHPSD